MFKRRTDPVSKQVRNHEKSFQRMDIVSTTRGVNITSKDSESELFKVCLG